MFNTSVSYLLNDSKNEQFFFFFLKGRYDGSDSNTRRHAFRYLPMCALGGKIRFLPVLPLSPGGAFVGWSDEPVGQNGIAMGEEGQDDETVGEGAVCPVALGERLARLGSSLGGRGRSSGTAAADDLRRMSLAALNLEEGVIGAYPHTLALPAPAPPVPPMPADEWEEGDVEAGPWDDAAMQRVTSLRGEAAPAASRWTRPGGLRAWCQRTGLATFRRFANYDRAALHFVVSAALLTVVSTVATVLELLGLTSSHWSSLQPHAPFSGSAGLWKACATNADTACADTADIPGVHAPTLHGAQATALLAVIFGGASIPLLVLSAAEAARRHPPAAPVEHPSSSPLPHPTPQFRRNRMLLPFRLLGAACCLLLAATVAGMTATSLWLVVGVGPAPPHGSTAPWEYGAWMHNAAWLVYGADALAASWAWVPVCRSVPHLKRKTDPAT